MKSEIEFHVVFVILTTVSVFMLHESLAQGIPDANENIRILSSIAMNQADDRHIIGTDPVSTDFKMFAKAFDAVWPHKVVKDRADGRLLSNISTCSSDLTQWVTGIRGYNLWALSSEYLLWLTLTCIYPVGNTIDLMPHFVVLTLLYCCRFDRPSYISQILNIHASIGNCGYFISFSKQY
jgi:hypothetical protein